MLEEQQNFVHHIHHKDANNGYRREVTINGSVYSISLSSDDPDENMDFLTRKAMKILKQLIRDGK